MVGYIARVWVMYFHELKASERNIFCHIPLSALECVYSIPGSCNIHVHVLCILYMYMCYMRYMYMYYVIAKVIFQCRPVKGTACKVLGAWLGMIR